MPTEFELASWDDTYAELNNPKYLRYMIDTNYYPLYNLLYQANDNSDILWSEISNKGMGLRRCRFSQYTHSAVDMQFLTKAEYFQKRSSTDTRPQLINDLILGGYSSINDKKNRPLQCPIASGLWAKDYILEYIGCREYTNTTENATPLYDFPLVKITINFETLPFLVDVAASSSWYFNPNFVEVIKKATNNRISAPVGYYRFTSGAYSSGSTSGTGFPAMAGLWLTQQMRYLQVKIYSVPDKWLYGTGVNISTLKSQLDNQQGYVNSDPIFGYGTQQVLLDSTDEGQPYYTKYGERRHDVVCNFIVCDTGFNKALDMSGSWSSVAYAGSTNLTPFLTTDFKTGIFNRVNPF